MGRSLLGSGPPVGHGQPGERVENGRIVERYLVKDPLDFHLELDAIERSTR